MRFKKIQDLKCFGFHLSLKVENDDFNQKVPGPIRAPNTKHKCWLKKSSIDFCPILRGGKQYARELMS